MNLKEAAEMALEALEDVEQAYGNHSEWFKERLEALRQALADEAMAHVWEQKKKQWVGLTAPEVNECYDLNPARFASRIEAKLKEKNAND